MTRLDQDQHIRFETAIAFLKAVKIGLVNWQEAQALMIGLGLEEPDQQEAMMREVINHLEAYRDQIQGKGDEHYQKFVDDYWVFYQNRNQGIKPKIGVADGKALKDIINYLRREAKDKSYKGARQSWLYILQNWDRLGKFYANQTKLTNINKNLNEILTVFRNGTHDKQTQQSIKQSAEQALDRSLESLL